MPLLAVCYGGAECNVNSRRILIDQDSKMNENRVLVTESGTLMC